MGRSIVVEVRKALVDGIKAALLAADPANKKVLVSYGWMGGDETNRREAVYTNRPRATHAPASLKPGRTFRNESMEFDVVVYVLGPKKSPEQVDARVMEIGQVVEEFVAQNNGHSLNVPGLNWMTISAFELENRIASTGSLTIAQYTVSYDARLT